MKAENQLLDYATLECRERTGKHMSLVKAYEVKSLIYSTDEDYDTAMFYLRKAIEIGKTTGNGRISSQIENLIGLLLDASQKKQTMQLYDEKSENHILSEAENLIESLESGDSKNKLTYEVNTWKILI